MAFKVSFVDFCSPVTFIASTCKKVYILLLPNPFQYQSFSPNIKYLKVYIKRAVLFNTNNVDASKWTFITCSMLWLALICKICLIFLTVRIFIYEINKITI